MRRNPPGQGETLHVAFGAAEYGAEKAPIPPYALRADRETGAKVHVSVQRVVILASEQNTSVSRRNLTKVAVAAQASVVVAPA